MITKFLTFYDDNYKDLSTIIIPHFKKYCDIQNYNLIIEKVDSPQTIHPYWIKIHLIKKHFSDCDFLIWSDLDIKILDLNYNFISLFKQFNEKDLIISSDNFGICAGFFMLKNTEWSHQLIDSLLFLNKIESTIKFTTAGNPLEDISDQHTLKCFYKLFPSIREKTHILDDSFLTNKWLYDNNKKCKIYHLVAHEFSIEQLTTLFINAT